jgi:hypothetical protein
VNPGMKLILAAGILFIGLDVYSRWQGTTLKVDLLKPNQIGAAIAGAQVAAAKGTVQGATGG